MDRVKIEITLHSIETKLKYYLRPETKLFLDISFLFNDFNDDLFKMLVEETGTETRAKLILQYYKPDGQFSIVQKREAFQQTYLGAFIYGTSYRELFG